METGRTETKTKNKYNTQSGAVFILSAVLLVNLVFYLFEPSTTIGMRSELSSVGCSSSIPPGRPLPPPPPLSELSLSLYDYTTKEQ